MLASKAIKLLLIGLLASGLTQCKASDVVYVEGETCPEGYSHITEYDANENQNRYCSVLPPDEIVLLEGHSTMRGANGKCEIQNQATITVLPNTTGSLCGLDSRVKSWNDCPNGTRIVQGSNTRNFCVKFDDISGLDHQGLDMCRSEGKGAFVELKTVYTSRETRFNPVLLDENQNPVLIPPGTLTLICEDKPKPIMSTGDSIVSCPLGSEYVRGRSAPEHCNYIWGKDGFDTDGDNLCQKHGLGEFKDYTHLFSKAPFRDSFENHDVELFTNPRTGDNEIFYANFSRMILCEKEYQPIFDNDGNLQSCPPYSIFIKSNSAGDHCNYPDGNLGFDIENDLPVCSKTEYGEFHSYIVNEHNQIQLICENEPEAIPYMQKQALKHSEIEYCADNEEFISGKSRFQTMEDHCALKGETSGKDSFGNDVCLNLGMNGFARYDFPLGVKTIICECPKDHERCDDKNTEGPRPGASGGNRTIMDLGAFSNTGELEKLKNESINNRVLTFDGP